MIVLASDHGGYELKEAVKRHLDETGVEYTDCGCFSAERTDYPAYAKKACDLVAAGEARCALLFCGTGIGISIAANKIRGIRAASCSDCYSAKYTRLHNDANALCLGGRVVGEGLACELVDVFLNTGFEGGRHQRRIDLIAQMEKNTES